MKGPCLELVWKWKLIGSVKLPFLVAVAPDYDDKQKKVVDDHLMMNWVFYL